MATPTAASQAKAPTRLSPGSDVTGRHFQHKTHWQENRMFAPIAELTREPEPTPLPLPGSPSACELSAACEGVSTARRGASCPSACSGASELTSRQHSQRDVTPGPSSMSLSFRCTRRRWTRPPHRAAAPAGSSPPSPRQPGGLKGLPARSITDRLGTEKQFRGKESRKTYLLGVFRVSHLVIDVWHHLQRATQRGHRLPGGRAQRQGCGARHQLTCPHPIPWPGQSRLAGRGWTRERGTELPGCHTSYCN